MTADRARPLVIVLHGGGGAGRLVEKLTGFSALADSEGFVVVYPDAVNRHWNDGREVTRFRSQRENVDDVGFVGALIDTLAGQLGLDRSRVYAAGVSNGGMMCYRLACELSGRLAAVAPVAAAMPESLAGACQPERPVSLLAINGTEDRLVPFQGGGVGLHAKRGTVVSVRQSVEQWVRHNGCSPNPDSVWLPDADPHDRVRVKRQLWGEGRDGAEVVLYTVEGGGHTWPGGAERPTRFGRRAKDMDATRTIWDFFSRHRR
jgi:polyhydroxybutyrate depolymerase